MAETIKTDPSFLANNPHLISLLSLFQDRDDFDVDVENGIVKPVQEEFFLKAVAMDIKTYQSRQTHPLQKLSSTTKDLLRSGIRS